MVRFAVKLLTLALFSAAILAAPLSIQTCAAGGDPTPSSSPPSESKAPPKTKKKTSELTPGTQDAAFVSGYRAAYATIYDRNDYAAAIGQLKALGHDDNAAVANLIGYSYRKLGDYKVSQIWYERALKADPDHVKTWQYYGLWQVEQGQPRSGAISPEPDRRAGRHRQRGISLAGLGSGKAARHRPGLLISATTIQPAQPRGLAPALFCSMAPITRPAGPTRYISVCVGLRGGRNTD